MSNHEKKTSEETSEKTGGAQAMSGAKPERGATIAEMMHAIRVLASASAAIVRGVIRRRFAKKTSQAEHQLMDALSLELLRVALEADPARVALEHWREVPFQGETAPKLAPTAPLHTPSRLAIARARLADGVTVDELARAVDGAARSPSNRERDRQSVAAIWGSVDAVQALAAIGARE